MRAVAKGGFIMKEKFINFNPEKIFIKLAELIADQEGIKAPKATIEKLTYKGKPVKQA